MWLYQSLVNRVLKHDGYFVTYFHPWEFYPLGEHPEFKMPFIIRNHSGQRNGGTFGYAYPQPERERLPFYDLLGVCADKTG